MAIFKNFKQKLFIEALFFVVLSLLIIFILNISTSAKTDDITSTQKTITQTSDEISHKVRVYYFHGNFRCYSCRTIERYTKESIETFFSEEIKSGILEFMPVNTDEKENEHFVKDYQLYTKSVVLSLRKDEKEISFKNLEKVWQYLKEKDKFFYYIKQETKKKLKEVK